MSIFVKKVLYFLLLSLILPSLSMSALANNSIYIATSGSMSKQKHLEVVSNNAANVNTNGFEQDSILFEQRDNRASKRKKDTYVITKGNYKTGGLGPLKPTGRKLDMAIVGNGYFMIITPAGPRYSLDGAAMIDSANTLVNHKGFPIANKDGQPIVFPETYKIIQMEEDGTIFAGDEDVGYEEVGVVGMFVFSPGTNFRKEGDNMLIADRAGIHKEGGISGEDGVLAPDDVVKLASGYIRASNVSSTKVLTEVIDLQRSSDASNELVKNIGSMERNMITRVMKTN